MKPKWKASPFLPPSLPHHVDDLQQREAELHQDGGWVVEHGTLQPGVVRHQLLVQPPLVLPLQGFWRKTTETSGRLTFAVTRVKVKQLKEKLNEQHDASWKCSVIQEVQEGEILNILILFVCKAETFVTVFTTVVDLTHVHGAYQQWLQCPPLPLLHTHFLKGTPWFIDAEPGLFLFEMCHKFSAELMNSHKMLSVIWLELPLLTKVCF